MDCNGCVREYSYGTGSITCSNFEPYIELALAHSGVCSSLYFTLLAVGICFVLMLILLNAYFEFPHLNMIIK